MAKDPYEEFSLVYDHWQSLYPRPFSLAIAPRVRAAVRAHGAPVQVLADTACGTGTFASWWHRTHPSWHVYGIDRSEAMIRSAREATGANRGRRKDTGPEFLVQDIRRLVLPRQAGVITCLFDSLNHITRQWDLLRAFRRIRTSLAPGGLFIFDLIDELSFPEVFSGSSILNGPGLFVGMETEYREEREVGYGDARYTFFHRSGSSWRRLEFKMRERRWFRGEIRDLLNGAELELVRLERIDPYESRHFVVPRTFWVCRRER